MFGLGVGENLWIEKSASVSLCEIRKHFVIHKCGWGPMCTDFSIEKSLVCGSVPVHRQPFCLGVRG